MQRNIIFLAIAVTLVAVSMMLGAQPAHSQASAGPIAVPINPIFCNVAELDFSGDGHMSKTDILMWWSRARACIDESGEPRQGVDCDKELDLNGDGVVDFNDLTFMYQHYLTCFHAAIDLPPAP